MIVGAYVLVTGYSIVHLILCVSVKNIFHNGVA
nr:MAG TPA: hypothetical protein [Caudoviricetes sp.]